MRYGRKHAIYEVCSRASRQGAQDEKAGKTSSTEKELGGEELRGLFHEVREFFVALFERPKPRYIGFLKKPSLEDDRPNKGAKNQLGFRGK